MKFRSRMKTCICCGLPFPLDGFYKHPKMADGHFNKCIGCCKAQAEARRHRLETTDPLWRENELSRQRGKSATARAEGRHRPNRASQASWAKRNRHKTRAQLAVKRAIDSGRLIPKPCHCGQPAEAHHEDYTKPLDVIWLCTTHHAARHIEIRRQKRLNETTNTTP